MSQPMKHERPQAVADTGKSPVRAKLNHVKNKSETQLTPVE